VPVTFDFATANGSALAGSDYGAKALTGLTIPAGQTSKTFTVTVYGDTAIEANESFTVALANATGATIQNGVATGTVLNDDGVVLSIADVALAEGASGTKSMVFTVKLSRAAAGPVGFAIQTNAGTATPTEDYASAAGAPTIPAGETSALFYVTVNGDTTVEPNEDFTVVVGNVSGVDSVSDGSAIGTILNDEGPTLSVDDVVLAEGDSGQVPANITVRLSQVAAVPVNYTIATAAVSATAGSDYVARTYSGTFSPGQLAKNFPVNVIGDTTWEPYETFNAVLTAASGASIRDAKGLVTITNDDGPLLAVGDVTVSEGASGLKTATFVVSLSGAATAPVTFDIGTADASATVAGNDYVARTLTGQSIPAGMLSKVFGVSVRGDTTVEPDEVFHVNIYNLKGPMRPYITTGNGIITNDD
jgi:hypothetical protein